jgi:hypothetical protein
VRSCPVENCFGMLRPLDAKQHAACADGGGIPVTGFPGRLELKRHLHMHATSVYVKLRAGLTLEVLDRVWMKLVPSQKVFDDHCVVFCFNFLCSLITTTTTRPKFLPFNSLADSSPVCNAERWRRIRCRLR